MDIFTQQELSPEILAQIEASKIAQFNSDILQSTILNYESAFTMFWYNPNATPQLIADRFGNNAYKLFVASDTTRQFIQSMKPEYVPPSVPYAFEINPDGTVTIAP